MNYKVISLYLIISIFFTSFSFAAVSSSSISWASRKYVDNNFCKFNGTCFFSNLIVNNVSVIGDYLNVSVVNYNVTGNLTATGVICDSNGCIGEGNFTNSSTDKRTATVIVAAADSLNKESADFICDGVDDDQTIELAIESLPANGGEVKLLDGEYIIANWINISRSNIKLSGQGFGTLLTAKDSCPYYGLIGTNASFTTISDLKLRGSSVVTICTWDANKYALYVYNKANYLPITISNIYEVGYPIGIFVNGQVRFSLTNSIIQYSYLGLYDFGSSTKIVASNNAFLSNQLSVYSKTDDVYSNNFFNSLIATAGCPYDIGDIQTYGSFNVISQNIISYGVVMKGSNPSNNVVSSNTFLGGNIIVSSSHNNIISTNTFNTGNIIVNSSSRYNTISGNQMGLNVINISSDGINTTLIGNTANIDDYGVGTVLVGNTDTNPDELTSFTYRTNIDFKPYNNLTLHLAVHNSTFYGNVTATDKICDSVGCIGDSIQPTHVNNLTDSKSQIFITDDGIVVIRG